MLVIDPDLDAIQTVNDPDNNLTQWVYNDEGQVTEEIGPAGTGNTYTTYNSAGEVATEIDPDGRKIVYSYYDDGEEEGELWYASTTSTTPVDALSYTYDSDDDLVTAANSAGGKRGRAEKGVGSLFGGVSEGQEVSRTRRKDSRPLFPALANGQVLTTTDPNTGTTTLTYDGDGNEISEKDPDNNLTQWVYNDEGQVTEEIGPAGTGNTYTTYNSQGLAAIVVDPDGRKIVYSYNDDGEETGEQWYATTTSTTPADTLSYTYDAVGDMLTASNDAGTYTYTYYPNGAVETSTFTTPANTTGITLTYGYDDDGNVTEVADGQGSVQDGAVNSTYNLNNQLTSVTSTANGEPILKAQFGYDPDGNEIEVDRYTDGTLVSSTDYGYDANNNITSETVKDAGNNVLLIYNNAYDAINRITSETLQDYSSGTLVTTVTPYTYDADSQVTSDATSNYSYDANGNRTNPGYTLGVDNQIASDGTWNYIYDAAGNMIGKTAIDGSSSWTYSYSLNNQLLSAKEYTPIDSVEVLTAEYDYVYDVFGDMISQTAVISGNSTTENFAYDTSGASIGIDAHVNPLYAQLDAAGTTITERFLNDQSGTKLARIGSDTNGTAWLLTDQLGSTRAVLDAGGDLEDEISYDAFGNIVSETNWNWTGDYTFTGLFDFRTGVGGAVSVGIIFAKYRGDNLSDGQWISQDQTGFSAGDANLRRYAGNDGANAVDGSGLQPNVITIYDKYGRPKYSFDKNDPGDMYFAQKFSRYSSTNGADEFTHNLGMMVGPRLHAAIRNVQAGGDFTLGLVDSERELNNPNVKDYVSGKMQLPQAIGSIMLDGFDTATLAYPVYAGAMRFGALTLEAPKTAPLSDAQIMQGLARGYIPYATPAGFGAAWDGFTLPSLTQAPLALSYRPTTLTLAQIRQLPQPAKWQAGELYVQELSGSLGQDHFPVPAGGNITGNGGRFVDAPVGTANGGVLALEVKTYGQWRTVSGVPQQQSVPLTIAIEQQILKDVWLRDNLPNYSPRWVFLDAAPSPELAAMLRENRIASVTHGR